MELKISVVVTVKNDEVGVSKLRKALDRQTIRPDEVIIIRAEEHGNCSRGRGRNIGIRKARNQVIAVTDAGCRPHRDWLEKLTRCATLDGVSSMRSARNPRSLRRRLQVGEETKVLSGSSSMISETPSSVRLPSPLLFVVVGWYRAAAKTELQRVMAGFLVGEKRERGLYKGPALPWQGRAFLPASRSIMFTKAAWEVVGGYPEEAVSGAEDLEFARRLAADPGVKMIYCPEAMVDWQSPKSLGEFFRDIVKHTRGNVEVGYWPHLWRNLTVVLRWMAIGVWSWLGVGYLVWVMGKGIKIRGIRGIGEIRWLPVVQLAADAGVIWGLGLGIIGRMSRMSRMGLMR